MNTLLTACRSEEMWISDLWCAYTGVILWALSGLSGVILIGLWLMHRKPTAGKLFWSILTLTSGVFPLYTSALGYHVDYVSYEMYLTGEWGESYDRHWIVDLFWVYFPLLLGAFLLGLWFYLRGKKPC